MAGPQRTRENRAERGPLLVAGFSVRAAAASAARSGFQPLAIDHFGDADLRELCPTLRVEPYPEGLIAAARRFPDCPWMYTGGLENRPDLIDQLARRRTLYGNSGNVLREVRDPELLAAALRAAGLPTLRLATGCDSVPPGQWVAKPLRSCGGRGVHPTAPGQPWNPRTEYLQQCVRGLTCGGLYLAAGGKATWLGATRQLSGAGWAGAAGFDYAGSIGPLRLSPRYEQGFRHLGAALAARFGLSGLFGVDVVLARGRVWPLEVNPRYTASVEVLELSDGEPLVAAHVLACREGELLAPRTSDARRCAGKVIVYPADDVAVNHALLQALRNALPSVSLADVPTPGQCVAAGQPLLSLLAQGSLPREVMERLRRSAETIRQQLARR